MNAGRGNFVYVFCLEIEIYPGFCFPYCFEYRMDCSLREYVHVVIHFWMISVAFRCFDGDHAISHALHSYFVCYLSCCCQLILFYLVIVFFCDLVSCKENNRFIKLFLIAIGRLIALRDSRNIDNNANPTMVCTHFGKKAKSAKRTEAYHLKRAKLMSVCYFIIIHFHSRA